MTQHRTYLDWNATAPLRKEARDAVIACMDLPGNASSVHAEGRAARAIVETARAEVAALVGAQPSEVTFTSGATEANAWVVGQEWSGIILSDGEHDSVWQVAEESAASVRRLPLRRDGRVRSESLAELGLKDGLGPGKWLFAMQAANNETGVIQPVAEAFAIAREHGMYTLCDAVQLAGRENIDFTSLGADYLTISAHKLGGPKGAGALVARGSAPLVPMIAGGGQERRRRAGTENVAAIAGFGAASRAARQSMAAERAHVDRLRARLEAGIADLTRDAVVIGTDAPRLANTVCVAIPGRQAGLLVAALDLAGVAVSAGAACSSGKVGTSRVLAAMGVEPQVLASAIRISLGPDTTENDIAAFLAAWKGVADAPRQAA